MATPRRSAVIPRGWIGRLALSRPDNQLAVDVAVWLDDLVELDRYTWRGRGADGSAAETVDLGGS